MNRPFNNGVLPVWREDLFMRLKFYGHALSHIIHSVREKAASLFGIRALLVFFDNLFRIVAGWAEQLCAAAVALLHQL